METIIDHITGRVTRALSSEDTTRGRSQRFTGGAPFVASTAVVDTFSLYYLRRSQDDDSFAVLWLQVGAVTSTGYLFGADKQRHPAIEADREAALVRLSFPTARPTYAIGRIVKAVRDHAATVFTTVTHDSGMDASVPNHEDTIVETPSAPPGGEA